MVCEAVGYEGKTIWTLDFSLSDARKQELYDFGYGAAKAFFAAEPDGRNTYGKVPVGQ